MLLIIINLCSAIINITTVILLHRLGKMNSHYGEILKAQRELIDEQYLQRCSSKPIEVIIKK